MTIPVQYPALIELQDEFSDLESSEERIQYLIELGQALPDFPAEFCTEEFRVMGCQSMVWIVPSWDGNRFHFAASSDAPMVRGLVAVLMSVYSGSTPAEILAFPMDSVLEQLHLRSFLSPLRSNGLFSMIKRIRQFAESKQAPIEHGVGRASEALQSGMSIADNIDSIRAEFPILKQVGEDGRAVAYLDNAASTQRPQSVIDSIQSVFSEHYANVHRSGHAWAAKTTVLMEESRESLRRYVNAESADEVIFTAGATASINLVANAWGASNLGPGDEILLTEMEHHSNIVPWQQLCKRVGCKIVWVPFRSDYTLDLEQFAQRLSDRTKLVAVTAVSNVFGTINPVREMARLAHEKGAVVLVDAAQAVPHGRIDVRQWDADFAVFSGHKMLASTGIGVCYGKRALLEEMREWQGGGSMIKSVTFDGYSLADLPHKFEAGTPAIVEAISMKAAVEYIERFAPDEILQHERRLVSSAADGLAQLPGVRQLSPIVEQKCGVLSFVVDGIHGEEIARVLDGRSIAIRVGHHCAMPLHARLGLAGSCRASFYLYNNQDDVNRFVDGVKHAIQLLRP